MYYVLCYVDIIICFTWNKILSYVIVWIGYNAGKYRRIVIRHLITHNVLTTHAYTHTNVYTSTSLNADDRTQLTIHNCIVPIVYNPIY